MFFLDCFALRTLSTCMKSTSLMYGQQEFWEKSRKIIWKSLKYLFKSSMYMLLLSWSCCFAISLAIFMPSKRWISAFLSSLAAIYSASSSAPSSGSGIGSGISSISSSSSFGSSVIIPRCLSIISQSQRLRFWGISMKSSSKSSKYFPFGNLN